MRSIAEDGSVVGFQLLFQLPDEVKVRVVERDGIEILSHVLNSAVPADDVVRELEGHLLIGMKPFVERESHSRGLEVYHVQRVLPGSHFR